jgi:hypothetical protein
VKSARRRIQLTDYNDRKTLENIMAARRAR